MGYGLILQIASITLVVVFVCLTDARPGTKGVATVILLVSLFASRINPAIEPVCVALKTVLSICIIIYLKLHGFVR